MMSHAEAVVVNYICYAEPVVVNYICYAEPVVLNHGVLLCAIGCESCCVILSHW
jgi:hypothetical protein